MDTILTALKETPIPTIMVVAGIVFLLLSIAGQLAGRVTVPPERQRQATIMGYVQDTCKNRSQQRTGV
jgi:hypothetical protein